MIKDDTVRWCVQKIALFYHVFPFSKQLTKQAAEKTDQRSNRLKNDLTIKLFFLAALQEVDREIN